MMTEARSFIGRQPPAVSGAGGHNRLFAVSCVLVQRFKLSTAEAWELLCEFNQKCLPPWSKGELIHKLSDAYKTAGINYTEAQLTAQLIFKKPANDGSRIINGGDAMRPKPNQQGFGKGSDQQLEMLATLRRIPVIQVMALVVAAGAVAGGGGISQGFHNTRRLNLHVFLAGESAEITLRIKQALNDLLQPIHSLQAELIERRSMLPAQLEAEYEGWRRELHRLESAPFPDPRHIEHLKGRIRDYQRSSRIQLLAENIRAGTLAQALSNSPDESILNIITDDRRLNAMLNRCHTPPVMADLDLLRAAWLGHGYFGPGDVALSAPCINTVAVCEARTLGRYLANRELREAGVTEIFMPVLVTADQCEGGPGRDGYGVGEEWAGLIRRLYEGRCRGGGIEVLKDCEVSWIVESYCAAFRADSGGLRTLQDLVSAVHLCFGQVESPVTKKDVLGALRLHRWLIKEEERTREVLAASGWAAGKDLDRACEAMMERIRRKGPIKPWNLYRCVRPQNAAVHRPVLEELLRRGDVVFDARGRVCIRDVPIVG